MKKNKKIKQRNNCKKITRTEPTNLVIFSTVIIVQRYCTDKLTLIICLTIMVTFLLIATFLTRLSGTSI